MLVTLVVVMGIHSNKSILPALTFEDLLDAIEWVESKGDANAVGDDGRAVGAYQLWKIYVDDVLRIAKLGGGEGDHPYRWRQNKIMSRIMVMVYIRHYATEKRVGREPTFEDMARIHNGGPNGYKKQSTKKYWEKVKKVLNERS